LGLSGWVSLRWKNPLFCRIFVVSDIVAFLLCPGAFDPGCCTVAARASMSEETSL